MLECAPVEVRDFIGIVPESSSVPVCKGFKKVAWFDNMRASRDDSFW